MMVPGVGKEERAGGDGEEDKGEGDAPGETQLRAVGCGGEGGGRSEEEGGKQDFGRHSVPCVLF